ncbi:MAG: cytochrome c [Bdellovibrionota bacterium]
MDNNSDQYNKGGLIAFVFSMVFCFGFFIYISFVHPGIDLKEVSEAPADGTPVFKIADVKKPWEHNEGVIAHGKKVFANNCAVCHGPEGKGDGPGGAALNPKPRNLVTGPWKQGGDSISQYKTLQTGIPGTSMVSFKHLAKADRWALVQFIHSITQDKPKEDPAAVEAFATSAAAD